VKPICPYCQKPAKLIDSAAVYNGRSYGLIWDCRPCDAYVGVHKGTENALGALADKETRRARMQAHAAFDPLWKREGMSRRGAYGLMQAVMGMTAEEAHISRMTVEQCRRLIHALGRDRQKPRIDSKPGVATPRTDHSLPDCGCTHVPPWEHCEHTEPALDGEELAHMRAISN
jgi:hypothetical protein